MPTLRPSLMNVEITLGGNQVGKVINEAEIGHDLVNGMFCIRGKIAGNEEAVFVYLNDATMTRGDGAFLVFSGDMELGERRVYSIPLVDILLKLQGHRCSLDLS